MRPLFHAVAAFAVSIASLSAANILLKMGMNRYGELTASGISGAQAVVKSPQLSAGVLLLAVQFLGMLTLFKWGWEASVVVPVFGLSYAVTAILGRLLLGEPVNTMRWLGIILVMIGIAFIAHSVPQVKPR